MVICKYQKRCTATSQTPKSFRFKEIILHRGGKTLITRKSVYFKIALVYYPEARNVNGKINIVPCDKANKLIKVFSFLLPCWCLNEKVWQGTFLPPPFVSVGFVLLAAGLKSTFTLAAWRLGFYFLLVFFFSPCESTLSQRFFLFSYKQSNNVFTLIPHLTIQLYLFKCWNICRMFITK